MSLSENLEKLSNACGVTGREEQVRKLLIKLMKPHADEVMVDKLENVIAVKKGKKSSSKVMIAAHMDEVGLMVKTVNEEGFLQFAKMGFDMVYQLRVCHSKDNDRLNNQT